MGITSPYPRENIIAGNYILADTQAFLSKRHRQQNKEILIRHSPGIGSKNSSLILQKYSSFYLPKVVAITGHKSEHRMTPKTLENSHFWQKESALWQDQI